MGAGLWRAGQGARGGFLFTRSERELRLIQPNPYDTKGSAAGWRELVRVRFALRVLIEIAVGREGQPNIAPF